MLGAFGITIYCYTKSLIEALIRLVAKAWTYAFQILRFGIEQEQVGPSPFCDSINMIENVLSHALKILIDDEICIDVDECTSLQAWLATTADSRICATHESYGCFV